MPIDATMAKISPLTASAADERLEPAPFNVFVHLARGFAADDWFRRWQAGTIVGFNEPTPYGYGRAAAMGCVMAFSKDRPEGRIGKLVRLGVRALAGFDFVHVWRNRHGILAADIVWTHTESQFLGVALLLHLTASRRRPLLLGQSVWLFDRWARLPAPYRWFYRWLIQKVDLLTVLSPNNAAIAQRAFPHKAVDLVLYGLDADVLTAPKPPASQPPRTFQVIAPGNDRHRDWATAVEALAGVPGVQLMIISGTAKPSLADNRPNVEILRLKSQTELLALFDRADAVLVPLTPNEHASGITVLMEAALRGLPVVSTQTGGVEAYFSADQVLYVPPLDPAAMRDAILRLKADPAFAHGLARRAQSRMGPSGLSSHAYVARHVQLSRQLLSRVQTGSRP